MSEVVQRNKPDVHRVPSQAHTRTANVQPEPQARATVTFVKRIAIVLASAFLLRAPLCASL